MPSRRRSVLAFAAFSLLLWISTVAPGGEEPGNGNTVPPSLDTRVIAFLQDVSAGNTQSAYEKLLQGSQLLDKKPAIADLVAKTDKLETLYGECRESEQITAKRIGEDLVLMKYLFKCEQFPVVWYFTFYRTPGETAADSAPWRVIAVRFDTELELLAF